MSQAERLAALEAQALANTAKIQELSRVNAELKIQSHQQKDLIARYELGFADGSVFQAFAQPSKDHHRIPPSHIKPTPFHATARLAPELTLSFVVPGYKGETLAFKADILDQAFILKRTLKRRGFGDEMAQKSVLDFLEVPLVKVEWAGKDGEIGKLA